MDMGSLRDDEMISPQTNYKPRQCFMAGSKGSEITGYNSSCHPPNRLRQSKRTESKLHLSAELPSIHDPETPSM